MSLVFYSGEIAFWSRMFHFSLALVRDEKYIIHQPSCDAVSSPMSSRRVSICWNFPLRSSLPSSERGWERVARVWLRIEWWTNSKMDFRQLWAANFWWIEFVQQLWLSLKREKKYFSISTLLFLLSWVTRNPTLILKQLNEYSKIDPSSLNTRFGSSRETVKTFSEWRKWIWKFFTRTRLEGLGKLHWTPSGQKKTWGKWNERFFRATQSSPLYDEKFIRNVRSARKFSSFFSQFRLWVRFCSFLFDIPIIMFSLSDESRGKLEMRKPFSSWVECHCALSFFAVKN